MVTTQGEPRETSGMTTSLLLRHIRAAGGDVAVRDVLARAQVPHTLAELEDRASWVSHVSRLRLFEATTAVLGDPDVLATVGAKALSDGAGDAFAGLLRAQDGPANVYRELARATPRFMSNASMRVSSGSSTVATIEYEVRSGHEASRLDCLFIRGLLSAVPRLLGLRVAALTEETCQADGARWCTWTVHWARSRRTAQRRDDDGAVELAALRRQLAELERAASDLVSSDDVDTVLERITDRAAAAVPASGYVLVLDTQEGDPPVTRSRGLPDERAAELAGWIVDGSDLGVEAVVVDVASSRRRHGRLAALYGPGQRITPRDRPLLEAYASHAAAALDLVMALDASRREEGRALALLSLAHELAGARDMAAIGRVVSAALPRIIGCAASTLLIWDAAAGVLRFVATSGYEPDVEAMLLASELTTADTPELKEMLAHHESVHIDLATASAPVAALMRAAGTETAIAVPLLAGDVLMGVATAAWVKNISGTPLAQEAVVRLSGVADQAAQAMDNARLLATVRHQSVHDALTGLPNRVLFGRTLDDALRRAPHGTGTAVLFCDLDRFKHVNDSHGHASGDELLRQVGSRIRGELRPGDTVARLGGDEFGILLGGIDDERQPVGVAGRLLDRIDEPFRIGGHEIRITGSIGIAVHVGPDGRGEKLLAAADSAMYIAKQRGRGQVVVAGEMLARRVVPSLEAELGMAVAAHQLRLFYQPVVDVSVAEDGQVVGAEALLRWAHPRLGLLAPGAFLPLAEETGLISELDLWAVDAACTELAEWRQDGPAPLHVAVNLSSATLVDPRLLPTVRSALTRCGLEPGRLHLEIVESRSLVDLPGVVERLVELRQMGARISLDDFGTGYSTLAWLQALPVDQLKIDRSFIMRLPDHSESLAVVRGVLALARELGIEVIAEGVEEPAQLAMLRAAGCELVQGYLLGRPAPLLNQAAPVAALQR